MDQPTSADAPVPFPIGARLRLHTEAPPPPFTPMRLVLQQSGAFIDVSRADVLIGRHTEADIRLPLPDVSRRHCRLVFADGGWVVIDQNSLNGVQVNGERVLQAPLCQDDCLRIGGFEFLVELRPLASLETAGHVQSILKSLTQPHRQAS